MPGLRSLLISASVLWATFAWGASPDVVHMTLQQAVEVGLANSALVKKNDNNVALSGEQLLQNYAQFLPNLGLGASYSYAFGNRLYTISGITLVDQRALTPSYTLSSTLNLFNGLADYSALKAALAHKQYAIASLDWARQQVILDIVQSYLQVTLDQDLVDIAVKNLAASNARLQLLQGQTQVGAASRADFYRQQAQTSSDELLLSNAETRLNDDVTVLIRKLRIDPLKKYEFEAPPLGTSVPSLAGKTLDELIELARTQRSDVKAQRSNVEATDWGITQARSGYLPHLDLSFARSAAGTYLTRQVVNGADSMPPSQQGLGSQLGNQVEYSLALNLTWNIFDRFVTRYNVAAARLTWDNAQIDESEADLQAVADVRIAYSDYLIAQRQLVSAQTGLKAAKEAYDAVTGRYSVGAASFLDVLTSQAALTQAQSNQAQAVINLKLREAGLSYSTGNLGSQGSGLY